MADIDNYMPLNNSSTQPSIKTRYAQSNLAACLLPWTTDYNLDIPIFEEHLESTLDLGYRNLYLMGTAGEGYALADGQFRSVVDVFAKKTVVEGLDPQVGVIALSMEQLIERLKYSYDLGIRMFQISLPSWGALDEKETLLFF